MEVHAKDDEEADMDNRENLHLQLGVHQDADGQRTANWRL